MDSLFSRNRRRSTLRFASAKNAPPIALLAVLSVFLLFFSLKAPAAAQDSAAKAAPQEPGPKTTAQEPAGKSAAPVVVRACTVAADSKPRKQKPKGKGTAPLSTEPVPACLEASASPLDIHGFFQSFVRAEKWNIGEEQGSEDLWTFARYLSKDELLRFAKEGPFAGRVHWRDGRALIQVRTVDLEGGFTRVLVSARFQGYGESVDQFAPPKESWQLDSNSTLENSMLSSLESHFRSLH